MLRAPPSLLPALAAAAPARVVKKLDGDREVARSWTWTVGPDGGTIAIAGGETITVRATGGLVADPAAFTCTCLLTPRCFHVLAVAAALEVAPGDDAPEPAPPADAPREAPAAARLAMDAPRRAVASRARTVTADVLAAGGHGVGTILEGELLRVVHLARVAGLHRLAAVGLRVVRDVRDLAADADGFEAGALVEDLRELSATAHLLDQVEAPSAAIGVARRAYERIGHLRLVGLAAEPVVAGRGYGGVVTHVIADDGALFTISDVMPGGAARARGAYDGSLAMGDTTITHRALSRGGLFVQDATASADRRLGAGRDVKAVRASADQGWAAPAIRARFDEPLPAQLLRAHEALALPASERPRGATLLFLRGRVVGHEASALLVETERALVRLVAPPSHGALATFENLRQLASAEGLALEVLADLVPDAPRTLSLIAFGPSSASDEAEVRLVLPPDWHGLVNAGYDVIQRSHLDGRVGASDARPLGAEGTFDPLHALRRRVERVALHGARSLPPEATAEIDAERVMLGRLFMPQAGERLGALAAAARAPRGRRGDLRDAWLAAATYARAASIALWREGWSS